MPNPLYLLPGIRSLQGFLNQLSSSYVPPPPGDKDEHPYKILLIHAHPDPDSFSSAIADTVATSAKEAGHTVRRISLYSYDKKAPSYTAPLSREERALYFTNGRSLDPTVAEHLRLLEWCDTLIWVYPTWWMGAPAIVKGFVDRTLVKGEAWDFVAPGTETANGPTGLIPKLTNIHRIAGISTYGATFPIVTAAGDNGRRMLANAVRPILNPNATLGWLGLYGMDEVTEKQRNDFLTQVKCMIQDL